MEGIKHTQYFNTDQNRFIDKVQGTSLIDKGVRINKSQATAKIIDWAIKSGVKIEEIIK